MVNRDRVFLQKREVGQVMGEIVAEVMEKAP